jgi:hypothetical protein
VYRLHLKSPSSTFWQFPAQRGVTMGNVEACYSIPFYCAAQLGPYFADAGFEAAQRRGEHGCCDRIHPGADPVAARDADTGSVPAQASSSARVHFRSSRRCTAENLTWAYTNMIYNNHRCCGAFVPQVTCYKRLWDLWEWRRVSSNHPYEPALHRRRDMACCGQHVNYSTLHS